MLGFVDPTAQAMEDARKRNIMATELGMKPTPYRASSLPLRFGFELKVDGIGLLDVNGHVQTLEGVPFDAAAHVAPELEAIRQVFGRETVLHGEYIEKGGFNATLSAFQRREGSGAVVLWDAAPLKVWTGYETSLPLWERKLQLRAAIDIVEPRMVTMLDLVPAGTAEHIDLAAAEAVAQGQEGIVVKDADSPYVRGPSGFWMKLKGVETVDVPIQGCNVDGPRLKSLIVTIDGKPAVVPVGFSEDQRYQLAEFRTGRMVEIKHNGRTEGGALKGATFIRFRDDKESRA
jgi:ATP-dependent DNA ligase